MKYFETTVAENNLLKHYANYYEPNNHLAVNLLNISSLTCRPPPAPVCCRPGCVWAVPPWAVWGGRPAAGSPPSAHSGWASSRRWSAPEPSYRTDTGWGAGWARAGTAPCPACSLREKQNVWINEKESLKSLCLCACERERETYPQQWLPELVFPTLWWPSPDGTADPLEAGGGGAKDRRETRSLARPAQLQNTYLHKIKVIHLLVWIKHNKQKP